MIVTSFHLWINEPHCCHSSSILLMTERVFLTYIQLIVGHKGAMNVTEEVYTHIDMKYLLEAINSIYYPKHLKSSS